MICQFMHWSYDDLMNAPDDIVEPIIEVMQARKGH